MRTTSNINLHIALCSFVWVADFRPYEPLINQNIISKFLFILNSSNIHPFRLSLFFHFRTLFPRNAENSPPPFFSFWVLKSINLQQKLDSFDQINLCNYNKNLNSLNWKTDPLISNSMTPNLHTLILLSTLLISINCACSSGYFTDSSPCDTKATRIQCKKFVSTGVRHGDWHYYYMSLDGTKIFFQKI